MSRYTAEEKAESLRRARELLEQLNADGYGVGAEYGEAEKCDASAFDEAERPAWPTRRDILDPMSRSSEPLERWKREQEELECRRQREREASARQEQRIMTERKVQSDAEWNAWLNAAIEAERKSMFDIHAQVIAEERKNYRAEIQRQVADAARKLRTEFNRQLRELRAELRDEGTVVDLPKGSWRHVA
jgi:hypothetical protein